MAVPVVGEISLFSGRSFHFHDHDGLVVECLDTFRVTGNSREDRVRQLLGATTRIVAHDFLQPMASEHLPRGAGGVENAIAEEKERVACMPCLLYTSDAADE